MSIIDSSSSQLRYKNNELFLENVSLEAIAREHGTPSYVYSKAAILNSYQSYSDALGNHPGTICYAVKANSNLAVLQLLAKAGAGFDIVSAGELMRVLKAGGEPEKIIFSGVGKSAEELSFALEQDICCFNIESEMELERLQHIAADMDTIARISLRVNPDVDAKTHPYISTGLKENKFGVPIDAALQVYEKAAQMPNINIVGVDCHIGSQLTDTAPFLDALERLLAFIDQLDQKNIPLKHLDLGGGIGVRYQDETPPDISAYLEKVKERIAGRNLSIFLEPGRSIVANAGVLLTTVEYLKPGEEHNFAVVDAAMNDNLRPSLYQAWQEIVPVKRSADAPRVQWDIVGPVCETGDFLGKGRQLNISQGDTLAMLSSGAYGFVMSSNYNTRGRACEILVDGDQAYLVRAREDFAAMIQGEELL